jgi:hypothetical protein
MVGLLLAGWVGVASAQQCTQTQLHDEFFLDTTSRNYVSCTTDGNLAGANVSDTCVLGFFNAPCTNNAACKVPNIMTREEILQKIIDAGELETLYRSTAPNDVARKGQLDVLINGTTFDMSKAPIQQLWKNVFAQASSPLTNTAIQAAQQKDAPRSQIVCGRVGTLTDVSCGLRGACQ